MQKRRTIVLLSSDQPIPNVMFLKWYFRKETKSVNIIFISTKKMEEKNVSQNVMSAIANVDNFINEKKIITVDENDIISITEKLKEVYEKYSEQTEEWYVNFTGGTKPMSIAIYSFFKEKGNVNLFYQPIGKNLQKVYPEEKTISSEDIISLEEYFKAYGISYKSDSNCIKDWKYNSCVFELVIEDAKNFRQQMQLIQNNPYFANKFKNKNKDKRFIDFENLDNEKIQQFKEESNVDFQINEIIKGVKRFGVNPNHLEYSEMKYITGGWFEEYVYQKLKEEMYLEDDKIALNVTLEKNGSRNELDVVYLDSKNQLHVIECKSFIDENTQGELLNNTIYKAQAIKSNLGLFVKSHLYTKSPITKNAPLRRAESFGIEIVDGEKI